MNHRNYFQHLLSRDHADLLEDDETEEKDYPGGTPPRNREDSPIPTTPLDEVIAAAKVRRYRVNGELREFYTIGELARLLNRKPVTIRMWERRGWIPHANYRTPPPKGDSQIPGVAPKGNRLYSPTQVRFLIMAVEEYSLNDQGKADWVGFKQHTAANWPL